MNIYSEIMPQTSKEIIKVAGRNYNITNKKSERRQIRNDIDYSNHPGIENNE